MDHSFDFSQLCTCGPRGYAALLERVDACAALGRSYEYPGCRMPEGCTPSVCTVGFWRSPDGYLLYFRPALSYHGSNHRLSDLFARESHHFHSFEKMASVLSTLCPKPSPSPAQQDDTFLFHTLRNTFGEFIFGQPDAVAAVAFKLCGHVCKLRPRRPLSLVLYGPTGVGKSELAKGIAPVLNRCCPGRDYRCVWTELNTFTQPHSAYRLTGAPPGYVGYDDPPIFEEVRSTPNTVFVFDELEKAHPEILKVFMSVLDEGRCTIRHGCESGERELDFRRCIFVFTSNLDLSAVHSPMGFAPPAEAPHPSHHTSTGTLAQRIFWDDERARQALTHSGVLREIAARFSGLIGFHHLAQEDRVSVTVSQIKALAREYGLSITAVSPALARTLTPADAFSARSTAAVLEGLLMPLLLPYAAQNHSLPLQLTGTADAIQLLPA